VKQERSDNGFSLLELIITLGILAILVMGTIPMAQNAVKREKESKLRDALATMRAAIDEFKRDTYGACPQGSTVSANPTLPNAQQNIPVDPRSRVVIDDCKIFDSENLDRYPPTLDQLVSGVRVKSRGANLVAGSGLRDDTRQATELNQNKEVIKVYLRDIPVDPMTGEKDWKFRSSYQSADSDNWDDVNVFDVRSNSKDEALNGEKYSDW
jgi:prepilin-type N-terminal cleavage/methylation domain-containing protein